MPTPPVGGPWSLRDTVAQWLSQADVLRDLGLPESAVFQADTAESPEMRPFIVLRWGDVEERMGMSEVTPVDGWVYDDFGDYNRATQIAKTAGEMLKRLVVDVPTIDGRISQVTFQGVGGDLADDGFKALVKPFRFKVVGNGS